MRFIEYTAREQWARSKGGLYLGERHWASFMVPSGHPWVNVPPIW